MNKNVPCGVLMLSGLLLAASAEVVVDLEFADASNRAPSRVADVMGSNETTYAWDENALLFDGAATNSQKIRGAYTLTGAGVVSNAFLEVSGADQMLRLDGLKARGVEGDMESRALILWDAEDFLAPGFNTYDSSSNSWLSLDIETWNQTRGARFVIRDGDSYYVSQEETSETGAFRVSGDDFASKWGAFSVTNWMLFDSDAEELGMGVSFEPAVDFTNVTAVGFLIEGLRRGPSSSNIRVSDFRAGLVDEAYVPPPPGPTAEVVRLDTSAFADQPTERAPDYDDTHTRRSNVTYAFSLDEPLLVEPGPNAVPIYGGASFDAPSAGILSNAVVMMDDNSGGAVRVRGEKAPEVENELLDSATLLFWKSEDFLVSDFAEWSEASYISANVSLVNAGAANAVLRDGDRWYVSDVQARAFGDNVLMATGSNARWAEFNPTNFVAFRESIQDTFGVADSAYEVRVFTNVTGVGMLAHVDRGGDLPSNLQVSGFSAVLGTSRYEAREDLFFADFEASEVNTGAWSKSSPSAGEHGGLTNLNAGTAVGVWSANALNGSGIYTNTAGGKVLYAANSGFEITAEMDSVVDFANHRFDISTEISIVRTATSSRRNYLTALDDQGRRVFNLLFSGATEDDGGSTLYIETPTATNLLASGLTKSGQLSFLTEENVSQVGVRMMDGAYAVYLDGVLLTNGVPYESASAENLAELVFTGDTLFIDNVRVEMLRGVAAVSETGFAAFAERFGLSGGAMADDDQDGLSNLAEYALNGNPTNGSLGGVGEVIGSVDGFEFVHARLADDSALTYRLIDYTNLVEGVAVSTNGWTTRTFGPVEDEYQMVTNRYDVIDAARFIELEIQEN